MEWLIENIGLILTVLGFTSGGGIIGLYLGRNKEKAQTDVISGSALKSMQEGYTKFTSDMNERMDFLRKELDSLKLENIEQRKDIRELTKDNRNLHKQLNTLLLENNKLKLDFNERLKNYEKSRLALLIDEESNEVIIDDLIFSEYNEWVYLNKGVRFKRVYNKKYKYYFITEMMPEKTEAKIAEFGKHWHSIVEECKILKGHMIDKVKNVEYSKDDVVVFPKGIEGEHKPIATMHSLYEVIFKV